MMTIGTHFLVSLKPSGADFPAGRRHFRKDGEAELSGCGQFWVMPATELLGTSPADYATRPGMLMMDETELEEAEVIFTTEHGVIR